MAHTLAEEAGFDAAQTDALCELGTLINYNSYGRTVSELHFAPDTLYQTLLAYQTPWAVLADLNSPFTNYAALISKILLLPLSNRLIIRAQVSPW